MATVSIVQFGISALAFFYAVKVLKTGRSSFLAIYVIVIISFDSLGLALAPYLPLESITYLNNPLFLIRGIEAPMFLRQCSSHWLFLLLALLGLRWELSWPKTSKKKHIVPSGLWGTVFFIFGVLLSVKYYVNGPGWILLRATTLGFSSTSEAIAHRVEGYLMAGFGQGSFMASVAAYVVFPLSAALVIQKKNLSRFLIFAVAAAASLSYALQTRQKAPLLWTQLCYIILFLQVLKGMGPKWNLKRWLVPSAALFFVFSVLAFEVNFGQTLSASVQGFFYRLFIIPGATETNYFVVFPESIAYRGLGRLLSIPLGRIAMSDAVSVYDTARAATGDAFSANASFLAVAWSAAGYLSVLLISILLIATLLLLDRAFMQMDKRLFVIALALSPAAMITIVSDGLTTHIGRGGLIVPGVLFVLAAISSFRLRA